MKICIPTFLTTSQKAGIAFYTVNLIHALQEIDSENEYYLLVYEGNKEMFNIHKPNFHKIVIPFKGKNRLHLRLFIFYYHSFILKKFFKRYSIDLVHIPSTWFVSKEISSVITIHDIVEYRTNRYGRAFSRVKQLMVETALKNARSIITVSEFSKQDICSIGANPDKIFVTYNGVNELLDVDVETSKVQELLKKYNLTSRAYFIFVGTAQLHKNIPRLIHAFDLFNKEYPEFRLVIAGKRDNASESIEEALAEVSGRTSIILLDYIDDATKSVLIKEAAAFVFVSLHEGFGMPILEANTFKTPLIVSNSSSLPEVAANTALYVDPLNIEDIYQKMRMIVSAPEVKDDLINAADENLRRFDWKNTARKTLNIYKQSLQ